jgi:hypothetical protein
MQKFSTTDKTRDDEDSIVVQAEQNSWCQTPTQLPYLPTRSFELGVIGHSHRLTFTGLLEEANPN